MGNMVRRSFMGFLVFIVGCVVSIMSYSFFRAFIKDLFQWTTQNGIQFAGKDFFIFADPVSYISFGIVFLIFYVANRKANSATMVQNGILLVIIFSLVLVGTCAFQARFMIIECTACDGVRVLRSRDIPYELILAKSAFSGIIPSLYTLIQRAASLK